LGGDGFGGHAYAAGALGGLGEGGDAYSEDENKAIKEEEGNILGGKGVHIESMNVRDLRKQRLAILERAYQKE
jgi:hypothetical protein